MTWHWDRFFPFVSIMPPMLRIYLSSYCSSQKDKRAKPGTSKQNSFMSDTRGRFDRNALSYCFSLPRAASGRSRTVRFAESLRFLNCIPSTQPRYNTFCNRPVTCCSCRYTLRSPPQYTLSLDELILLPQPNLLWTFPISWSPSCRPIPTPNALPHEAFRVKPPPAYP